MKNILVCLGIFALPFAVFSQCPSVSVIAPDTACNGLPITLQSNVSGSGPFTYAWDFNAGDMQQTPHGGLTGNYGATLASTLGIDFGEENGNFIGYSITTGGALVRIEYGNSIENTPVVTGLGNIGGVLGAVDIRLLKEDGNWYGLANCACSVLYRFDFGNSLLNLPTVTTINLPGGTFNNPYYITLQRIKDQVVCLVPNASGGTLSVIDFGTSITNNNPTVANMAVPGSSPVSVSLSIDCENIYGFVAYASVTPITQIDFGNNISTTPVSFTSFSTPSTIEYRRSDVIRENGKWYLLAHWLGGYSLDIYQLGASLSNLAPTRVNVGGFGVISGGNYNFSIHKTGSAVYGVTTNFNNGDLSWFKFDDLKTGAPATSTDANPTVSFSGFGNYYYSLTVTDSISTLTTEIADSVFIGAVPDAAFTASISCLGDSTHFINTSTIGSGSIVSTTWDFDDTSFGSGDTVSHIYTQSGVYNVSMTVTSDLGCSKTIIIPVTIAVLPTAGFSFSNNQCATSQIPFTDLSTSNQGTLTNWTWDFGDNNFSNLQSPSHAYDSSGNYTITLIIGASTGCTDTIIQNIDILPVPVALFSTYNTCIGETSQFINESSINGGSTLSYSWAFGDGNISTGIHPTNIYPAISASYPAQLIVNSNNGCSDTIFKTIRIGERPIPEFSLSIDTACVGNNISFFDGSFPASGETIASYYWNFGDNTYDSISVNPTHQYALPGSYIVTLTVVSPTYCDSSISHTVFVIDSPTADFTTSNVCFGNTTFFTDNSTNPPGSSISNWHWNFGDNDSALTTNTSHVYAAPGTYQVTLLVSSPRGCTSTLSKQVKVYSLPVTHFGISKACTNNPISFTDSSSSIDSIINVWDWNFGDNSTHIQTRNAQHTYLVSGAYPVTLITTTAFGCIDSITRFAVVESSPQFSTRVSDTCYRLSSSFRYIPIGTPPPNLGYLWNFGDSTAASSANPTHVYAATGNYNVVLTITDLGNGCSATVNDTATVFPLPIANFAKDSSCVNEPLQFTDQSSVGIGSITKWKWTFGSHGSSILQNPILTLATADSVAVKLFVQSSAGCKDSIVKYINVYPLPVISFVPSVTYGAPPLPVNFANTSNASVYSWNFGDGSLADNSVNPLHTFADTGFYKIQLTGTSNKGCRDSISQFVYVLIPFLDLSIENVSFTKSGNLWQLKTRIRNKGNTDITSFELTAKLDGKSMINELSTGESLLVGKVKDFDFSTRFNVDENENPAYLCVSILNVNGRTDDEENNNQRCITTGKEFEIFDAYPNPFHEEITLGLNLPEPGKVRIELFTAQGLHVTQDTEQEFSKGYNNFILNGQHLTSGVYIAVVHYRDEKIMKRIIRY